MSLQGRYIVVTRATDQADTLVHAIEAADGVALRYPCIEMLPPTNVAPLDAALRNIANYRWVLFTSANTVQAVTDRLHELDITVDWSQRRIGAVGDKTDRTIEALLGRTADVIPDEALASALAHALPLNEHDTVLVPQSSLADDDLVSTLQGRSAVVTAVDAYTMGIGSGGDDIPAYLQTQNIDALTFTSGSTVTNFVQRIAPQTAWQLPAVCIGPSTQTVAHEQGFTQIHHPENYNIGAMVDLLQTLF